MIVKSSRKMISPMYCYRQVHLAKNLGPKIATILDVQQISDIIEVFDHETFSRPIYAGNAISKIKSRDNIKVITVRPTCFEPLRKIQMFLMKNLIFHNPKLIKLNLLIMTDPESDRLELTSAKIVISGGRGAKWGEF